VRQKRLAAFRGGQQRDRPGERAGTRASTLMSLPQIVEQPLASSKLRRLSVFNPSAQGDQLVRVCSVTVRSSLLLQMPVIERRSRVACNPTATGNPKGMTAFGSTTLVSSSEIRAIRAGDIGTDFATFTKSVWHCAQGFRKSAGRGVH